MKDTPSSCCQICGAEKKTTATAGYQACATCRVIISNIKNHPETIQKLWTKLQDQPVQLVLNHRQEHDKIELPDVLDGKRYQTIDREHNKWYLSVSEVDGKPVEVFASTAFDRDHELQSRISNLTTITRLISLMLRHIFLNETLTLKKCLKQIKRSSRQKNDLPDMLFGVLNRYSDISRDDLKQNMKRSA
jgi:hypothetical protein